MTSKNPGIDALLTLRGKTLTTGQELRIPLYKAPQSTSADVINGNAPPEQFPIVAKFPESVVTPDFAKFRRFYQQDIPSQKDDSDEEATATQQPRKKRKFRRNEGARRQWVLQEEEDYLETMIAQRQQGKDYKQDSTKTSTRYEGLSEHNPSHYVLLGASSGDNGIQVTMLPTPYAVQTFSQPAKISTLSMTQAEQAIADQRSHMTRYMMHKQQQPTSGPVTSSKARLLGKLKKLSQSSGDEDDDDVMADVKFANRKGGGVARKELLDLADDDVAVDADGVLGGSNDAEFGGRSRFLKLTGSQAKAATSTSTNKTSTGYDGMAMADDFYQRDVKAEYEELDYDANEQFDDDDVDLGEGEVNIEGGFQEDIDDEEDVDEDEEDDDDDEAKKAGLATIKGLKDMLAKARGEAIYDSAKTEGEGKKEEGENAQSASAESTKQPPETAASTTLASASGQAASPVTVVPKAAPKVQFDEFGQRVLTQEGVQYEIFLHNKSIAMKKLMKLYNIKKKSPPERIKLFQAIIKELCNITKDPVEGNVLVLKQHFAKGI